MITVVPALILTMLRDRFPAEVAVHWAVNGAPNGWAPFLAAAWLPALVTLAMVALMVGIGIATRSLAVMAPVTVGLAAFMAVLSVGGILMQSDGAVGPIGPMLFVAMLTMLGISAAGIWWLRGRIAPPPVGDTGTFPPAFPGDPAVRRWEGHTRVGAGVWASILLTLTLGIGTTLLIGWNDPWAGAAMALLFVAIIPTFILSWQRIVIDDRGLTTTCLGFTVHRVPLDDILSAGHVELEPLGDYGGAGHRSSHDGLRDGIVTSRGEGLIIQRRGAKDFVIACDDAPTAARTLATLRAG